MANKYSPVSIHRDKIICQFCGTLQNNVHLQNQTEAISCTKCKITTKKTGWQQHSLYFAYLFAALIMFLVSLNLPFISMTLGGVNHEISLPSLFIDLFYSSHYLLALTMFFVVFFAPTVHICGLILLLLLIKMKSISRHLDGLSDICKLTIKLLDWNMGDVYLVGILIAYVKLRESGDVYFLYGFGSYVVFILLMIIIERNINKEFLWNSIINIHKNDE